MFCDSPECRVYYKKKFSGGGDAPGGGGGIDGANLVRYTYGMPANDAGLVKVSDLVPTADELYNALLVASAPENADTGEVSETYASRICLPGQDYLPLVEDMGAIIIGKNVGDEGSSTVWHFIVIHNPEPLGAELGVPLERGVYFSAFLMGEHEPLREGYEAYLVWDKK